MAKLDEKSGRAMFFYPPIPPAILSGRSEDGVWTTGDWKGGVMRLEA